MALTYLPMLLQQDVNKIYPEIKDFDIVPPPHWQGRVSHTFFLKRRGWLNLSVDFGGDKVIDYLEYEWARYWLVKDWTSIKVRKNDSTTTLFTWTYSSTVNHKFVLLSSVWWDRLDFGSSATSTSWWGIFTITDSAKSRTTNEFANKYIYINSATQWTWQIFQISSNTADTLTLARWWELQPTGITYQIFEKRSEVPAVVSNDWIYVIHNDSVVLKLNNFWTVVDCVYNLWRIMAVDTNDNIIVSYPWYNAHYIDNTSIIWAFSWAVAMTQFQDFVLLVWTTRIWLIKKEVVSLDVWGSTVNVDTFKPLILTNLLWAFSKTSFTVYNQWLYIFTSSKRFVALSINPAGTDRYAVAEDDQWIYIQQYLDSIEEWDDVAVAINSEKISLVHVWDWDSTIYLFDTYYRFRYRWVTELPIHWVKVFNSIYYLWDKVYDYDTSIKKDYWSLDYIPKIRVLFWENDMFSIKNVVSHKIYLWKNTSPTSTILYRAHIDWATYTVNVDLSTLQYLLKSVAYEQWTTLWETLLWLWNYWGYGTNVWSYFVADTDVIEIPVSLACSLLEIEVEWDFEFGGMLLTYEQIEPFITPINSVLWI